MLVQLGQRHSMRLEPLGMHLYFEGGSRLPRNLPPGLFAGRLWQLCSDSESPE
jgi:hypothetical protein